MYKAVKDGKINSLEQLTCERKEILAEINSSQNIPTLKEHNQALETYKQLMDELVKNLNKTRVELNTTIKSKNIISKYKIGKRENGSFNNI